MGKLFTTGGNTMEKYNEDYFERGIQTGASCYTDFRWMPELTIPMVMTMIDYMGIERGESVLDYGCAKGYGVKAFNMLGRDGYGYDISEYALSCWPIEILAKRVMDVSYYIFSYAIAKDVFEHIAVKDLEIILKDLNIPYSSNAVHENRTNHDSWEQYFEAPIIRQYLLKKYRKDIELYETVEREQGLFRLK